MVNKTIRTLCCANPKHLPPQSPTLCPSYYAHCSIIAIERLATTTTLFVICVQRHIEHKCRDIIVTMHIVWSNT